jgi:hypothetical protein
MQYQRVNALIPLKLIFYFTPVQVDVGSRESISSRRHGRSSLPVVARVWVIPSFLVVKDARQMRLLHDRHSLVCWQKITAWTPFVCS